MIRMDIKTFTTTCILVLFFATSSMSTNAPITTLATVANASGQVSVPITVVNFSGIGAISLSFDYNYSGLHYSSGTPNPLLLGFSINDNDLGTGKHRVIMGWYNLNPVSLSNGSTIMTVVFNYISGNDSLVWYDNGPSCEYADGLGNVLNDIPTSTYYINGFVCGNTGSPGTIAGPSSVCLGQTGLLYSISPMPNVNGYNWTVPPGAVITNGSGTTSITVNYPAGATSGNVTVNGTNQCGTSPTSTLAVTVSPLPIANAGNDTTILYGTTASLHAASGGSGSFSYYWTPANLVVNPNVQVTQTVVLFATTVFTVTVTSQGSSCQSSDQKVVFITGGPLTVNPTAYPTTLCAGESAQLYANAGGGSGNYTYSWTCVPPGSPPWTSNLANPVVLPDTSEVYHVNVNDGFNQAVGNTSVSAYKLPTAGISGGDTLCGTGLTTTLTVNLTGTPPWFFDYTDGLTNYYVTNQYSTPYLIVTGIAGTYTVFSLFDAHCDGTTSGSAIVAVYPVPPTPTISDIGGGELYSTAYFGNQWYKNKVLIPGATGQTFTPLETAYYCDIVTLNSCSSDTSNEIYVVVDGINIYTKGGIIIKPNPAREYIQILPDRPLTQATFDFYTSTGKNIKHITAGPPNNGTGYLIDISELSPGLYLLQVRSEGVYLIKKLIVE
jgi:hypothetical protein